MQDGGVEVLVPRRIAAGARVGLADATRPVDEHFIKTAGARPVFRLVAEVPFAKDARGVTGRFQHLGQRGGLWREAFTLENGVRDAVFELVTASEQSRAGGSTGGADAEILKSHALGVETVEVRRL